MKGALGTAREEVSAHAPRLYTMKINPEKIRDVIGKGGSVIRALTEETGTQIDIGEDGFITIASGSAEGADAAASASNRLLLKGGRVYEGTVVKIGIRCHR